MALSNSPSIVTNGLIFHFDAKNRKSYVGPPIQNLLSYISVVGTGSGTGYSSVAGSEIVNIPGIGPRTVYYNLIQNNYSTSGNCCPSLFQYGGFAVSPNTTYTYGILYRCDSGYTHPNFMYRYEYTSSSGSYVTEGGVFNSSSQIYLGEGWYYQLSTFTTTGTTNWIGSTGLWYYQYSTFKDKVSVAKIIVTPGNYTNLHPKYWPEVGTTRSASSQTILDLTNNNTINANSLTYGSDGSFSFGGSDYITVGSIPSRFLTFTVSVWFNSSSVSNYKNPIDCNYSSYPGVTGNVGPRLEQNSAGTLGWVVSGNTTNNNAADGFIVQSSGLLPNTWYNAVITWISGSANTYLNGVPVTINASTPNGFVGTFGSVVIGKGFSLANDRSFIGTISVVQIYNRALTTSEVLQNFNALRGRYGL